MKHKKKILPLLLALSLSFTSCGRNVAGSSVISTPQEIAENTSHELVQEITSTNYDFSFKDSYFDTTSKYEETLIELDGSNASYSNASVEQSSAGLTIKEKGTYILSGHYDRQIIIDADKEKVQLILNNVTINSSSGPAIFVRSSDKVTLTLAEGTKNEFSDSSKLLTEDQEDLDGVLYSKDDLIINGSGSLSITANAKHGIVSKDDLIICSSTIVVTAPNAGLIGKDCVKICDADLNISAGTDAIRSTNSSDSSLGFIYLNNTRLTAESGNDGLQAQTAIGLENNQCTITSGGGSTQLSASSSDSSKALKAGSEIIVASGDYTIDSQDDCLHSNATVTISGGALHLSSGDDGIHADTSLLISDGTIDIRKSYEGIESTSIEILGGSISIVASDDGLNGAGGTDNSAAEGRFGRDSFSSSTGSISIQGGYLYIDAQGDGIDSNGTVSISGGTVLVAGPSDNNNAALDYDVSATITGGIIVALGGSGMAQNFTNAENQAAILHNFSTTAESFALLNENNQLIASLSTNKSYSSILISTPEIQEGSTYSIILGAVVDEADNHGFAQNTSYHGGTTLESIVVDSPICGTGSGFGRGNAPGGPFNGTMPNDMQRPEYFQRGDWNRDSFPEGMTPPEKSPFFGQGDHERQART